MQLCRALKLSVILCFSSCVTPSNCSSSLINYPAYFCPLGYEGTDGMCYTLLSESVDGSAISKLCEEVDSKAFGGLYEKTEHITTVGSLLQDFHTMENGSTHFVWLAARGAQCHDPSLLSSGTVQWQKKGHLDVRASLIFSGQMDCCLAQATTRPYEVAWMPCSTKFRPICTKHVADVTKGDIVKSVGIIVNKIKCMAAARPEELERDVKRLQVLLDKYSNLGSTNTFPTVNFILIVILASTITFYVLKFGKSSASYSTGEAKQRIPLDVKAETRISSYEDLRSAYETYSPPTSVTTAVD